MIGRERHKLLQRCDEVIGDVLRFLVTVAAVDHAMPNRVERRAGAVALEPGKERVQRGVVVWQMTVLV
jgi:hypothetical protein